MFTEEGLSLSRVLFMRVLYLTNYTDLLKNTLSLMFILNLHRRKHSSRMR